VVAGLERIIKVRVSGEYSLDDGRVFDDRLDYEVIEGA